MQALQFPDLGLRRELLDAVAAEGYTQPTPIQAQAIPAVLEGRDLMGAAQTGTGKTAGFTLPLLQRLADGQRAAPRKVRALVLTPTRELAAQVGESVTTYGQHLPLRCSVVFGGVGITPQIKALERGVDVLVATPGRLLDLHGQRAVDFSKLEILVLDEADRMLDMGFIHDIRRILKLLPAQRQNLLFSATFSDEIRALAKGLVHDPLEVDVAPRNTTVELVRQQIHPVDKSRKPKLLIHLVKTHNWHQVLVFTRTKHGANRLATQLDKAGIPAAAIHGNKSQNARTRALEDFKANRIQVLVATDIAARGIDIDQLPHVINLDLPNVPEDYVHRIGRTGRAGASGEAVSLVSADEADQLRAIERLTNQQIPRSVIEGFEPEHALPASKPAGQPRKAQNQRSEPRSDQRNGQRNGQRNTAPRADGDAPARRRRRRGGRGRGPSQAASAG
ncbi:DEAD/DEAH box helicase [Mangrovimicrobium sediminis]|uniref:DEAD/DEAH box helicase n=1 Tax=Mangrovimicrobium sediminis TaxID=2562682 RepID=UPI00197D5396|nr:DEAD/DEAH box helicase [Haliea sp. SAOS-164]